MKILTILGVVATAFAAMLGSMTWVLVDIDERQPDGMHLFIPAPLALADLAVRLAPHDALEPVDIDLEPEYVQLAKAAIEELGRAGDFEMVRVEERDETVVVRIENGMVHVAVDNPNEQVRVRAPLRSIAAALDAVQDGKIRPVSLLPALDDLPSGRLVEVHDRDTDVTISVW